MQGYCPTTYVVPMQGSFPNTYVVPMYGYCPTIQGPCRDLVLLPMQCPCKAVLLPMQGPCRAFVRLPMQFPYRNIVLLPMQGYCPTMQGPYGIIVLLPTVTINDNFCTISTFCCYCCLICSKQKKIENFFTVNFFILCLSFFFSFFLS